MSKRCDGFILFMTLCIVLVISLLLLTCMQHVLLYYKALNKQEIRHQNFYQLENLALQLVSTKHLAKQCLEQRDAPNQVIHDLMNNEGCLLDIEQHKYRYFIEDLGDFACLLVHEKQRKTATHHFRITIVLLADEENAASALQIRFIKPSEVVGCLGKEHFVRAGLSSWRYLPTLS
jgi:hypothetical protein